jgi:hypothetical protein
MILRAQVLKDTVCALQRARNVRAYPDDALARWSAVEERVELNHAVNVGERDAQYSRNLCRHGLRDPTVETLRRVEGGQQAGSTQGGKDLHLPPQRFDLNGVRLLSHGRKYTSWRCCAAHDQVGAPH